MSARQKKSSRRKFLQLAAVGGVGVFLTACGDSATPVTQPVTSNPGAGATSSTTAAAAGAKAPPPGNTTATISIFNFGSAKDKEIYAAAYARVKQRYPNLTIEDTFTPVTTWADYTNKLVTQIAGGKAPDIINIAIEGSRLVVKKNLLAPLDEYIAQDPDCQRTIFRC